MAAKKVNRGKRGIKPGKPYPEFPLYAHAAGVWAKRIRGRTMYFGPWCDPNAALERFLQQRDYLYAGKAPPPEVDGVTLDEMVNRFLDSQTARQQMSELSPRQLRDYMTDGKRLLDILGRRRPAASLTPDDFLRLRSGIFKGRNATTATNIIVRIRSIFAWGTRTGVIESEANYGGQFALPSAKARRKALQTSGVKMFQPAEIRVLLDATARHANLHAMILLGINAGLGNTDCSELQTGHIDLTAGMIDFPRPKTGAARRAVLWSETIEAMGRAVSRREKLTRVPDDLADRVFITLRRTPYVRMSAKGTPIDSIGMQFRRLLIESDIHRPGLGFYALRHTFRTIADETRDFPAIDLVMGHTAADVPGAPFAVAMADRYRQRIGNDRLKAVADHVRAWLFD